MDYISALRKIIYNKKGIIKEKRDLILSGKYPNIYNFIINIYKDSTSIEETFKRILLSIDVKPVCPICGKPVEFVGKKNLMFRKYCSNSCRGKDPINNQKWVNGQKKYNKEHYGVEYVWQRNDVKDKRKRTLKERYGTETYNNIEKRKETNIKKYNDSNYNNHEKYKTTLLLRYGFDSPFKIEQFKQKSKQTSLERYGTEYPIQSDKIQELIKQHNLIKYGETHPFKTKYYKELLSDIMSSEEVRDKIKQTFIKKYGVDSPFKSKDIQDKIKQTCLEKYGVDSPFKSENIRNKCKQTCIDKYGVEYPMQSDNIKEITRQNNLIKYGETHPCKTEYYRKLLSDIISSKEVQDKIKQTYLDKYGVDNPFKSKEIQDKIKLTNLEKYGVDNPFKSKEVQDKIKQTNLEKYGYEYPIQSDEIKELIKQHNLIKYGETHPCKTEYYRKLLSTILSSKEIQQKIHKTKKKNGSYGKSKEEDYVYSVLVDIYGKDNVKRQYSSDLYPFACDFYIISEDLYIEYNGMWTHGYTPYIGSKENEVQLNEWKQKAITSKFYQNAIVTWTISDVKKRNTAKENNLNYIELWNIKDIYLIKNGNR